MINNNITKYINAHFNSELSYLPLIFFSKDDIKIAQIILKTEHAITNLQIIEQHNICISCKHFPYTCEEVPNEHDLDKILGCNCGNKLEDDFCHDSVSINRSYIQFSGCYDDETYMEHEFNDFEDCCSFSRIYTRYLVYVN